MTASRCFSPFSRRTALAAALMGASLSLIPLTSLAQSAPWPSKPIRVIVNFPPGGAADQLARMVGQPLSEALGQPVVIENRGGAGGNIGGEAVAKAEPDGYTLLMSPGGMVSINPYLYARMPFDPRKDLQPVASVARIAVYLVTRNDLPVKDAREFLAYLKANPGKMSFGSPGSGTSPHLGAELYKSMTGTYAVHVPYRGGGPALQDLLGGQFDFWFDPGVGLPHVRNGKLKLLAVGSPKRSALFPNVPTLEETGLKGFDADTYFGLYAPARVPQAVVTRINTEVNKILATPAVRERIIAIGGEAAPMTPAAFAQRADTDSKRFGALIRERGLKGD